MKKITTVVNITKRCVVIFALEIVVWVLFSLVWDDTFSLYNLFANGFPTYITFIVVAFVLSITFPQRPCKKMRYFDTPLKW